MRIHEIRSTYSTFGALMGLAVCGMALPMLPKALEGERAPMGVTEIEAVFRRRLPRSHVARSGELARHLLRLSAKHGFRPSFVLGLIQTESSFRPRAHSHAGAVGLMQLMPSTAKELARRYRLRSYRGPRDLRDPIMNLTLGILYLKELRDRLVEPELYLAAYNLGPSRVERWLAERPEALESIRWYVERIAFEQEVIRAEGDAGLIGDSLERMPAARDS